MCGRLAFREGDIPLLEKQFHVKIENTSFMSYNITPQQYLPTIRRDQETQLYHYHTCQFGLIPSWSKDKKISQKLINARAETVMDKPAFREAFRKRRCLIAVSGFYEWDQKTRQPYYFTHLEDKHLLLLAGIWEHWHSEQTTINSCAILTTSANSLMQPIHDRMPVLLDNSSLEQWLAPDLTPKRYQSILSETQTIRLRYWPVSRQVNNPRNNTNDLIHPVTNES